ncbi:Trp-like ion channel Pkd2 [Schizosaccharomyces japonicus yFS275]|uniref:Trp-like ion channel Pkd2 n=1 Tax=Schizosaccharomyces japonicus (strain yFS275 / FY16936) TaxID=402676 RepID=B6K7F8_SCHJY|nr:Trp-like ion channel Pkd2 [Schizosaccharomyces japonicus yFS275]EEB09462.1 Trp-like ion channel Pkd2 [Schizosaccharomyces japonicus yFS275]
MYLRYALISITAYFFAFLSPASAVRVLRSRSLATCSSNSQLSASTFNVDFFPANQSIVFDLSLQSSMSSNITIVANIYAYGISISPITVNPCNLKFSGFCPITTGNIDLEGSYTISGSALDTLKSIPGIAYMVPDLDASVIVRINSTDTGEELACVEASFSNTRSVHSRAVYWVMCVIIGVPLIVFLFFSSAFQTPEMWEICASFLAMFHFSQSQALYGFLAIKLPIVVESWAQNFNWALGIIRLNFMQSIFTWYIKSTGGTPSVLTKLGDHANVILYKRAIEPAVSLWKRTSYSSSSSTSSTTLHGIDRVAYRAGIETTNLFMTGLAFFVILLGFTLILVIVFRVLLELGLLFRSIHDSRALELRVRCNAISKGFFYRVVYVSFTQMAVLSMWEIYTRDSTGAAILGMYIIVDIAILLLWAFIRTVQAVRKMGPFLHNEAVYNLYSDIQHLMRWGFMYVPYKVRYFFFALPILIVSLVDAMFIGFGQGHPVVQGIARFVISIIVFLVYLVLRPFATKHMNAMHCGIAFMGLVSGVFILIMCEAFEVNELVRQVIGIVMFALNALTLLFMILGVYIRALVLLCRRHPKGTYSRMIEVPTDSSETKVSTGFDNSDPFSADMHGKEGPLEPSSRSHGSSDVRRVDAARTYPWEVVEDASYASLHGPAELQRPHVRNAEYSESSVTGRMSDAGNSSAPSYTNRDPYTRTANR